MKNDLLKQIKEYIPKNNTIILAFSGGPDSVYLFHMLKKASIIHPFKIIIAHFNHKIRGKESEKDEKFCKTFAKNHNIPIEVGSKNILKEKGNLEENARKARYDFLYKTMEKYKANIIITAHHLDDNIETFLMNFIRGTGLKGLTCMQTKSSEIFRPLLKTTKEEILNYLKKKSIKFCIDKTNFDSTYTRNNIRKNIIPRLKKLQPSIEEIFLRNWENLSQTQDFIDRQADKWLKENMKMDKEISLNLFNKADLFFQKMILIKLFNIYHGNISGLSKDYIQRAQKIINAKKTGKKVPFGNKAFLVVNATSFKIINETSNIKILKKIIAIPGKTKYFCGEIDSKLSNKIPKEIKKGILVDYSKCKLPIYVRSKKNGDTFRNIGMKGNQKLQDFFINKKIPQQNRDFIPIIVDKNDKIIAIGDIAVSENQKITKSTDKIISFSFKPSLENKCK